MSHPDPADPYLSWSKRMEEMRDTVMSVDNTVRIIGGKLQDSVDGINRRLDVQNGRIAGLEEWKRRREMLEEYEEGVAAGREEVLARWKNRDKAVVAAMIGAAGVIGPLTLRLAERFL